MTKTKPVSWCLLDDEDKADKEDEADDEDEGR